jgi:rSAM/selenodomain-associated transferase 2
MSASTSLSIVIPTWCEAPGIAAAVERARAIADEVVVVDAGSPDGTADRAEAAGARVVGAPRSRGAQLDAGARAATGDVLLFLHADTTVPPGARAAILEALADPAIIAGNFYLRFTPDSFAARLFTRANDLRRRWLRIYYGDSGLFVRRATYEATGGFRDLPILEDYELVRRVERLGRTAYLRDVIIEASARRFQAAPVRTLAVWTCIQLLYSAFHVSPRRLARLYRDVRETFPVAAENANEAE